MSKIKNGGLDQYGAEPFELQQFGTAGVEGVKNFFQSSDWLHGEIVSEMSSCVDCGTFNRTLTNSCQSLVVQEARLPQRQRKSSTINHIELSETPWAAFIADSRPMCLAAVNLMHTVGSDSWRFV